MLLGIATGCAHLPPVLHGVVAGVDWQPPGAIDYPPDLLREVTAALTARGLYDRRPVYGLAMQNSLRSFQHDQGLPVTGLIDPGTLAALGIDSDPPARETKPPPAPSWFPADLAARIRQVTGSGAVDPQSSGRMRSSAPPVLDSPGRDLSRQVAPVAALVNAQGIFCTGFLINQDMLLTSSSCLATSKQCRQTAARFNIRENDDGSGDYRCLEIVEIGGRLDYAAVRLEGAPGLDWGHLTLSDRPATEEEPVAVIGHPSGNGGAIHNCLVMGEGGWNPPAAVIACNAEIELPGAPVISRWSNRVLGLLSPGKIPEIATGSGSAVGLLSAECRLCETTATGSRAPGVAGLRRDEFLFWGPAGLSLIHAGEGNFKLERFQPDDMERWNLQGKYRIHAADIDGNGRHDLVLHNAWWLAILKRAGDRFRLHWISHERVGGWRLGAADRAWPGDFNGDGRTDLLFSAGKQLGVLLADNGKLVFAWRSGPRLGDWRFSPGDRFYLGDFTGNGCQDILVRRGGEAAVFAWRKGQLEQVWMADSMLGPWQLHGADEHFLGDFNGDGRQEVLVRRDRQMALWKFDGEQMKVRWFREGHWSAWPLSHEDELLIADFNGNGRDDVLIRNSRGIGLQLSDGDSFTTSWIGFDHLEGWIFSPVDLVLAGNFNPDNRTTVLLFNPWASARFFSTGTALVKDFILRHPLRKDGASAITK